MANNHEGRDPSQGLNRRTPTSRNHGGFASAPHRNVWSLSGMYFGGIALRGDGSIGKTHMIDPRGNSFIADEDVLSPNFGNSYPGGHAQAYQDIATKLSGAAGKICIEVCGCTGLNTYDSPRAEHLKQDPRAPHPAVYMSGFWIEGSRFVTSAHFTEIHCLTKQQTQNTDTYLKAYSASDEPKAFVCSEARAPKKWFRSSTAIPVYLLKVDRDSDLAIFQAYDNAHGQHKPNTANTVLLRSDITVIARCDKSQSAFTVGYYGDDEPLKVLSSLDEQTLNTFWPNPGVDSAPETYFPIKSATVMRTRDDSLTFEKAFRFPHYRTISTGDVRSVFATHQLSEFVFSEISTWFGSSGGMVGGFARGEVGGQLKPVIFGIVRGDEGRHNVIAAFTPKGIDWLFE